MTAANPFDKGGKTATIAPRANGKAKAAGFDTAASDGDVRPGAKVDPFTTPAKSSDYRIADFLGELVLVRPTEVIEEMVTEVGTTDAIRADVTPLTGELAGTLCEDLLVFQLALKRALRKVLEGSNPYLLGRLTKGTAKAGKSAPYIFAEPTPEEEDVARRHLGLI